MILPTGPDFDFLAAVCSHGFFVLAPNEWVPARRSLRTVVTLDDDRAVAVEVRTAKGGLEVRLPGGDRDSRHTAGRGSARDQRRAVIAAVRRMLRLDEDFSGFHQRCRESATHAAAAEMRFGRLLRSASLFEDIVKVICTCNTSWRQTTAMVAALVEHWGVPATPLREAGSGPAGGPRGFPTPARLAAAGIAALRGRARLGYRAAFVDQLAREAADGRLDLNRIESFAGSSDELYRLLRGIRGVGDYAAGHLLMLLGRYDRLAIDTELLRHLRERHPRRRWTPAAIRRHYAAWQPYQFLAYWYELWHGYVQRHGPPEEWLADASGRSITQR